MKKLRLIFIAICGMALISCTDNAKKEQINDESKEIEAQSQDLSDEVDENDSTDVGHVMDSTENDYEEQ